MAVVALPVDITHGHRWFSLVTLFLSIMKKRLFKFCVLVSVLVPFQSPWVEFCPHSSYPPPTSGCNSEKITSLHFLPKIECKVSKKFLIAISRAHLSFGRGYRSLAGASLTKTIWVTFWPTPLIYTSRTHLSTSPKGKWLNWALTI